MKRSILTSALATSLWASLALNASAATVANPTETATATSGAADSGLELLPVVNNGNGNAPGSNTGGVASATTGWSATANGSLYLDAGVLEVDSQTYTRLDSTGPDAGVIFGTSTEINGLVGGIVDALGLSNIAAVGLQQRWSATVDLGAQGVPILANTQYALSFNFQNLTGLVSGLDPSVLDAFTVRILDSSNNVLGAATSNNGLLGLTNLFDVNGTATVNFTTGGVVNGASRVEFAAHGLLTGTTNILLLQDLLDNDNTTDLYRISGVEINAVPEASHGMLAMMSLLAVLRWRRR